MSPFSRFLLVFCLIVLALLLLFGGGPFSGFSLLGTLFGLGFAVIACIGGTLAAIVFGALGLAVAVVAMVPLLVPLALLALPFLLLVGLAVLIARLAAN